MKFTEKLGISPKNLASIIRFKQYYETLCGNKQNRFTRNNFYNYYYDQSHFIKDFKRFTGLTPASLEKKINDFGKIFYNV
jgi:methylphosphotriester-DNA--protein-cysteine methyltransferase